MKTLDEIIFEAPYSPTPWETDALSYLKEYKELSKMWNDRLDKENSNPPLTWDELKQMEGKPVWLQWTVRGEWNHGDWNLVHAQVNQKIWFEDGNGEIFDLWQEYQGNTWQAYRKERE